jgi:hypothetical protein
MDAAAEPFARDSTTHDRQFERSTECARATGDLSPKRKGSDPKSGRGDGEAEPNSANHVSRLYGSAACGAGIAGRASMRRRAARLLHLHFASERGALVSAIAVVSCERRVADDA